MEDLPSEYNILEQSFVNAMEYYPFECQQIGNNIVFVNRSYYFDPMLNRSVEGLVTIHGMTEETEVKIAGILCKAAKISFTFNLSPASVNTFNTFISFVPDFFIKILSYNSNIRIFSEENEYKLLDQLNVAKSGFEHRQDILIYFQHN